MLNGAFPPVGIDAMGVVLAAVRAVWLVGLLSASGALLFGALETADDAFRQRLMRLTLASLVIALAGWCAFVGVQTGMLAGISAPMAIARAVPDVFRDTTFGRVAVAQLVLLAGTAATLPFAGRQPARWVGAILALGAVALQVGHLHAWAMERGPGILTAAALLHLLGAAAWLGGLLPLRLLITGVSAANAALAARRFSGRAVVCVVLLAGSALVQGWELLGGLPGVFGTSYGWTVLLKLVLFAVLLAAAAQNRFRLIPAFAHPDPTPARQTLLRNLAIETWAGVAVIAAASLLGGLQPGMHAQPVWPFTVAPSLSPVRADPSLALPAALAIAAIVAALALLIAMQGWRRWPALVLLALAAWFAAPRLAKLFVPALPTSFITSPTSFSATSIVAGAALYPPNCARCHGDDGRGDGPDARALTLPPGDLTAAYLWDHDDGELFWWLTHGIDAPYGGLAMPGFAATLDADARWHLIDFLRARNAGAARHGPTVRQRPLRAPDIDADCGGGRDQSLPDFRGRLVRLVFADGAAAPARPPDPPGVGVATVLVTHDDAGASPGACVASDPAVADAYAIATGLSPDKLAGSELLIDQNGWLRDLLPPGTDAADLANALRRIAASPIDAGPVHLHHHG